MWTIWLGFGARLNSYKQDHLLCYLPGTCPGKPTLGHPSTLFLFCFTPHWDPAAIMMLLSGTCLLHSSVGTKWPRPTLTEQATKHRHNILHVCMAHRESLPSHVCGLIFLSLSSFLCFSLYTLCSCLKMLNLWWVPLSSPHARGADQTGLDWQSQTKCFKNTEWLQYATFAITTQTGEVDLQGGDGQACIWKLIYSFFPFKPT